MTQEPALLCRKKRRGPRGGLIRRDEVPCQQQYYTRESLHPHQTIRIAFRWRMGSAYGICRSMGRKIKYLSHAETLSRAPGQSDPKVDRVVEERFFLIFFVTLNIVQCSKIIIGLARRSPDEALQRF